ncbi:hypothetical protein [Pedobacter sp.]|uniref:hypothetical protein n=1 Tax=Pedobacter sp. TaxID=1411316 RepID=UPI0031CDCA64
MKQFLIVHSPNARKEETLKHLKENGIEPEVVECEQGNMPYVNVLETVKKIIRENIEEENIIIYEDDVRLYFKFSPAEIVDQLAGKFSMVSTGAFSLGETQLTEIDGVLACSHYYGAQCVIYHKSSFPLILAIKDDYIDTISRFTQKSAIIVPFLTYQKDYGELNKDGQMIRREHQFKKESKRLEELIANGK